MRVEDGTALACPPMNLETGMRGDAKLVVTDDDTAAALGSGVVHVLGSPRLVALCEEATVNAVDGALDEGTSTVGMRIRLDHLQPTPVGAEVRAEAVLDRIDGRRLTFTVSAEDSGGLIAAGKITRAIIDVERFMTKCCAT
jgi:fluoroacetyl-CoA thioesterase